jgi:hypothetical protein
MEGILKIGKISFPINKSEFRYIEDDGNCNFGWEFEIRTDEADSLPEGHLLYGEKIRFYSQGDPIPIPFQDDLTGVEVFLKTPFDETSGEVYFTLYVFEHGDLTNLSLKFIERKGDFYKILVTAKIPKGTIESYEGDLIIDTWIKRLPSGSYGQGR